MTAGYNGTGGWMFSVEPKRVLFGPDLAAVVLPNADGGFTHSMTSSASNDVIVNKSISALRLRRCDGELGRKTLTLCRIFLPVWLSALSHGQPITKPRGYAYVKMEYVSVRTFL